ncbi:hypothetical protein JB92DRAFT_2844471 [Gautieria morchelliformis]|nr:hypothetical protein JB92DRAFT_2844471 [Gautieria morchelliformis]
MDDFYRAELEKALSEQHYGIVDYRVDHEACTTQAAFALVDLLEQRQIRVKLSSRGYEEHAKDSTTASESMSKVFETLEDLLSAGSAMYGERRMEELMARLSQLAEHST